MLENIKTKFLYFFRSFVFKNYRKADLFRKIYWDGRAADIQQKYNAHQNDFEWLRSLIEEIRPKALLEVGCGSGRLLPLYLSFPFIDQICLQDISIKALDLIQSADPRIRKMSDGIIALDKKLPRQDLIISNRVLQHIPPGLIGKNINHLCLLSDTIYVNELSHSDDVQANSYMNLHDYQALFGRAGFETSKTGKIDQQTVFVFKKKHL